MSNLSIKGTIVKIGESQNVSKDATKPFNKRPLVLEIPDGNYPQTVQFEALQDRCDLLDNYTEGQSVTVHFNLRGRQWDGKVFNTLTLWKIEAETAAQPNGSPAAKSEPQPAMADVGEPTASSDLPF